MRPIRFGLVTIGGFTLYVLGSLEATELYESVVPILGVIGGGCLAAAAWLE